NFVRWPRSAASKRPSLTTGWSGSCDKQSRTQRVPDHLSYEREFDEIRPHQYGWNNSVRRSPCMNLFPISLITLIFLPLTSRSETSCDGRGARRRSGHRLRRDGADPAINKAELRECRITSATSENLMKSGRTNTAGITQCDEVLV